VSEEAPEVYDLRGLKCPLPVLKSRRRLEDLPPGTVLRVETTDPLATVDIPHFCREHRHRLLETKKIEGGYSFLIERGG